MSSPFNKRLFVALAISITLHITVFVLLGYGRSVQKEGRVGKLSFNFTLSSNISSPAATVIPLAQPVARSVAVSAVNEPAPVIESAVPEGEYYYLYNEVEKRSDFVDSTPLADIEKIISFNFEVKIKVRVLINETGRVDSVSVLEAEPTFLYNEAAINALLKSRFSPAEKNGRQVKSQKILEIKFDSNQFHSSKN
ncbi:MAG: hypothetical protein B7Y56_04460 [Gallionellales bacterium 35-53-114]|jgi:TonB family protein|nr:MAG: hypothetical protein B7Y56_04460 [Gallionellales bacterium 35-53-114]OYZ65346.1 MAG: hypothetical protein B7Y04_01615 [Gallionellales bacterium 24-53-125]OZB08253.1 MAG: hypothetical protein B7X61_12070 [Gallionellales bacterium 39-52-133]HQS58183.1 energy transducer TonB [Gallionellaceae bacterium]HQS73738.1 energy transducer TonB [Gallionellaceae bacterium]